MKPNLHYLVMDRCEDWEQPLRLVEHPDFPPGGLLLWCDKGQAATLFPDRVTARAAIARTDHYRLAFRSQHPERKMCYLRPVKLLPALEGPKV